jgi:hypothetical protein
MLAAPSIYLFLEAPGNLDPVCCVILVHTFFCQIVSRLPLPSVASGFHQHFSRPKCRLDTRADQRAPLGLTYLLSVAVLIGRRKVLSATARGLRGAMLRILETNRPF